MESPARRAFLTGHRAAQTPWETFLGRLRRAAEGKVFDFSVASGGARLVPARMADVYRARSLCAEHGVVLALDGVPRAAPLDGGPVLWVEPGTAMSRFERMGEGDSRWFVQPGCLIGDLEEAGLPQFRNLPPHLTVAAWLADREGCDWDAGRTADSGLVHALVLLDDGTQANLGAFGAANQKPLDNIRVQQMIPRLFELASGEDAAGAGAGPCWGARYRLDALRPADGSGVNLAHLLLGHGGDLGWVEWVVLDERAPAPAQRPYEQRYFKRATTVGAATLDRAAKDLFDSARLFPDPGQRP
ncbi:hypothetical protein [Castellaniella sp. GW247-6E4]|uniref:hypothetical protein n=1 Tax=Castellaniella sp. GW247-6E4 TaxID=3140380 RepID=UPI003315E146